MGGLRVRRTTVYKGRGGRTLKQWSECRERGEKRRWDLNGDDAMYRYQMMRLDGMGSRQEKARKRGNRKREGG